VEVQGPFAGFLIVLIIVLVMIGIIYAVDIALNALDQANTAVAQGLNTTPSTFYSSNAEQALTPVVVPVIIMLVIAVAAFTIIHLKKR
jgi:heme/copper-type cytochrome/quinol oxidase subunit 2